MLNLSNIFGNGVIRYYFTAIVVDKDEGRRKKREPSCFLETNQGRTASKGGLPIAKGWYIFITGYWYPILGGGASQKGLHARDGSRTQRAPRMTSHTILFAVRQCRRLRRLLQFRPFQAVLWRTLSGPLPSISRNLDCL